MVAKILLLCSCALLCVQLSCQQRPDYCSLEAASGMCDAYFPRFYYNPKSDSCEHFIYGGCQGNENNFETVADCVAACSPGRGTDYCKLAPETGPCEGLFHRFYYNSATGDCENFVYGGCQGNLNNFETLRECQAACLTA